ncbi:MAG: hypothetical protein ACPLKQ_07230 [Candidatus Bathyarchaeales archaeon]
MSKDSDSEDITELVYNAIESQILETHKFCTIKDVMEKTGKSRAACEKALANLLSQYRICIVYERVGVPKIYVPKYMMSEILLAQSKPEWLRKYQLADKTKIDNKIRELKNQLLQYEMFERLLYATGEPLEEAVYYAFKWLGLKNVQHYKSEKDVHDVDFEIDNTKYIVEIKGKIGLIDKDDVEELMGWVKQEVLKSDEKKIEGILMINPLRKEDPEERKEALTNHAQKWLKMYRLKVFRTYYLFKLIKDVMEGKISKEKAVEKVIQGEEIYDYNTIRS